MHVQVNDIRIFFDVVGAKLAPDGRTMREKPTLLLLHGGPGLDHSGLRPRFDELADIAQVIYLDHRGNGRSEHGDPAAWTLAQWGDDVRGFCEALSIHHPIVYGVSFGGMVAQSYATRHPDHPAKLVLSSTAARMDRTATLAAFERLGGAELRAIAELRWANPTDAVIALYRERCFPYYNTRHVPNPDAAARAIRNNDIARIFFADGQGAAQVDFRAALAGIRCPTLVLAGEDDPFFPMTCSEVIAAHLPPALTRFERFPGCGHGVELDDPERAFAVIRDFILDA